MLDQEFHFNFNELESAKVSKNTLLIRTSFTNEERWNKLKGSVQKSGNSDGFDAYVDFVSDKTLIDYGVKQLIDLLKKDKYCFFLIADNETFDKTESTILAIHYFDGELSKVRFVPSETWSVENNLSIANMDPEDFIEASDEDGIFRGF